MPTIVMVSPKGGAGKSTSILILATQIARAYPVSVIDADPNHPLETWAKGKHTPVNLTVISNVDEDNISEKIEEAAAKTPFVLVDLEGTASKIVVMAVGQADFVIVPMQGKQLDANQAARALRVIQQHEKQSRRINPNYVLPYSVVFTRTNSAVRPKALKAIEQNLKAAGVPIFKTELHEREAFSSMFSFNEPLEYLDPKEVPNIEKAIANAEQFTKEVLETLRKNAIGQKTEVAA